MQIYLSKGKLYFNKKRSQAIVWIRKNSPELPILKKYSPQILFLILFFLILHPGVHSRSIPDPQEKKTISAQIAPRPQIYLREQVKLLVARSKGYLGLYIKKEQIAVYPIKLFNISPGNFLITKIQNNANGIMLWITPIPKSNDQKPVLLCGQSVPTVYPHRMELDDDYLEALYSYLRIGTTVIIY